MVHIIAVAILHMLSPLQWLSCTHIAISSEFDTLKPKPYKSSFLKTEKNAFDFPRKLDCLLYHRFL